MKLDVLAIAAHPDDVELACSGTLAVLAGQGKRIGILDLTKGEMGTRGTPELRMQEAQNAAEILGVSIRENAGLPDAGIENNREQQLKIMEVVRQYQPDICFIPAPEDRHPDHRNANRLCGDALFYSGLQKLETKRNGKTQQPWRPAHILQFMHNWPFEPDIVFDISPVIDQKEKAIMAFSSQFNIPEGDDGPETFISSSRFFEALRGKARTYGHYIGASFGEPFLYYGGPLPAQNLDNLFSYKPIR